MEKDGGSWLRRLLKPWLVCAAHRDGGSRRAAALVGGADDFAGPTPHSTASFAAVVGGAGDSAGATPRRSASFSNAVSGAECFAGVNRRSASFAAAEGATHLAGASRRRPDSLGGPVAAMAAAARHFSRAHQVSFA